MCGSFRFRQHGAGLPDQGFVSRGAHFLGLGQMQQRLPGIPGEMLCSGPAAQIAPSQMAMGRTAATAGGGQQKRMSFLRYCQKAAATPIAAMTRPTARYFHSKVFSFTM